MNFLITGTDTEVGKTYFTCLFLRYLRAKKINALGYKPFCCGSREDALSLHAASDETATLEEINPVYFRSALAPYPASMVEDKKIEIEELIRAYHALAKRFDAVLVEGVGGWEVPLTKDSRFSDFAQKLRIPVILVVNNKLGALNHTLLTLDAIKAKKLPCAGIVLNYTADERDPASISNRAVLENTLPPNTPILREILHGEKSLETMEEIAGSLSLK